MCAPNWARRRGRSPRFSQPVSLLAALTGEDPSCRASMVEEHQRCLAELVDAADESIAAAATGKALLPGSEVGLVMFAGELAAAIRPDQFGAELPEELRSACAATVARAMPAAAGLLAGLVAVLAAVADGVE